ncbi:hypothetical protein WN48_00386 [Eufriesea mexicana]|uniref:Uncharacterized protein n=1 Tax=Eufriesea mexicana TaxID=516756 RepID=A0A310SBT5_9HYME|nr:PREDICTED: kinesin-related protein 4-like [Eufriesea mexicana]XP_017763874.1 PREDICTED: kinesin-related protein 4-like [Eufriesea mexicana]OAD52683.1 hypothetical protein WN48_00386 [Eufriesea mexicana]
MSEENEHTSEETEAEMNAENHNKEQSKSDTSMLNNETEQPMLEDEEMPTYISVSSPSRRENPDVNNTKQDRAPPIEEDHSRSPYSSDDQGGYSIYVLSSGEESNHPYNDEEDEYPDSDDMDEMDLENEHENAMVEDEEDEDDDDDDDGNPLKLHNDDDEDNDTEYDQECFDRASDDFVLNNRLKQHHKERSLSLQDLNISNNSAHSPYNKKRHRLNIFRHNYFGIQQNAMLYPVTQKKQTIPFKYQHVESKVKQYIRGIKEQTRKSMEKRIKEQGFILNKNQEENKSSDTGKLKTRVANKTIKDYAEKAIQDLQREETEGENLVYNTGNLIENGENNKTSNRVSENQYKHVRKDTEYNDVQNEKCVQNSEDKLEKRNGSVDVSTHHIEYQNALDRNIRFSSINQSSLVNGHQSTPTFINLRTLSYDEYIHGTSNTGQREELPEQRQEKTNESEAYNDTEMISAQEIDNSNTSCPLKIASVKSIRVMQDESENLNFAKINATEKVTADNTEVIELKTQLNQKDAQFHNLRDAYQKVLSENIKMKQELDVLRKSLANYENKSKPSETKIAAVQTDVVIESSSSNQDTATSGEINKISTSSIVSTASSSDKWVDSAYSPAISLKPPDLTPILSSDDSIVLTNSTTPRKIAHPLSRTFITSSRILQTLSNITRGKAKIESPLARNSKKRTNENSTDQLQNLECNSSNHASSSKKRKATEMLGAPTFIQPFKIPHTIVESERKNNSDATDVEFRYSEEQTMSKPEEEGNMSANKDINDTTSVENKIEEIDDQEDSVKCFIYREDEKSKNRSFLIQAEEPTKDKLDNDKNDIQECGPYLLGNLEVRMSEINGTISVWGKEIDHELTSDNEDDMEISVKSSEKNMSQFWQNTSQTRFNGSPLICSTNKKQKIPSRLNRSSISQCCHSLSLNSIKSPCLVDDASNKRRMSNVFSPNTGIPSCENCDSSKCYKEWSKCKDASSSQEKLHSCCTHHIEIIGKGCNCGSHHEKQKSDVSPKFYKDKIHSKGIRRNSCKNMPTSEESKNHLHENGTNATAEISEVTCKYHTCRCSLQNMVDNNPHSKCCNTVNDASYTCKSCSNNSINNHENSGKHTYSHSLSNEDEEEPLIPLKRSNETLETRQRRISGKRVRGILMDLLRGCGDCRNNSTTSLSKPVFQQKGSPYMVNGPPQIKISPSTIPEPTCSTSTQCNDRCCHAYAHRIESQLEEFRMEMERVRSRSDAILDMLNMLHSVDMN